MRIHHRPPATAPAAAAAVWLRLHCALPSPAAGAGPLEKQLVKAVFTGDVEIVRLLMRHGADITATDRFGFTPLSVAGKNNRAGVVAYLMQQGAEK